MAPDILSAPVPPIRVMIVDDSAIIRGLLQRALKDVPDIEIVASAHNGALAIEKLRQTPVDITVLDVEMPEMDGMTALPQLLAVSPKTRFIMFSTLTLRNAEISLKALELGVSDCIAKPSYRTDKDTVETFYHELIAKIRALAPLPHARKPSLPSAPHAYVTLPPKPLAAAAPVKYPETPVQALAIGSSTGGPQALSVVLKGMAGRFPHVPVFITQHMPPDFTTILAQQLAVHSGRPCVEASDGMVAEAGHIYVAPGNYHMIAQQQGSKIILRLNQEPPVNFCRPSVDPMLQSLSRIYGSHLLVAILTGMGNDGLGGSRDVVAARGTVIAQNEETSVVWGMPRAVAENKLCRAVLPLEDIAPYLLRACP